VYLGYKHFRVWKYWQSQNIQPRVLPDEELRSLQVAVLLLVGQQETLYDPVAAVERAKTLIPHLESEFISSANHAMTIERHAVVNKRILTFLKPGPMARAASGTRQPTLATAV
jgi:pimeloyl-ACP methyl ester carboxylesterase